jgi:hypothetical protein
MRIKTYRYTSLLGEEYEKIAKEEMKRERKS